MGELFCYRKVINFPTKSQFLFQFNRFIPNSINNNNEILNISSNSDNNNNIQKIEKKIYNYKGQN